MHSLINNFTIILWYSSFYYPYTYSYDNTYYHNPSRHPSYHKPNCHNPSYHYPNYHYLYFHNPAYHNPSYHNPNFHNPSYHNSDFHDPNFHNPSYHNSDFHDPNFHNPSYHNSDSHDTDFHNPDFHDPNFHNPNDHNSDFYNFPSPTKESNFGSFVTQRPVKKPNIHYLSPNQKTEPNFNIFVPQTPEEERNSNNVPSTSTTEDSFDFEPQTTETESNLNNVPSATPMEPNFNIFVPQTTTEPNEDNVPFTTESNLNIPAPEIEKVSVINKRITTISEQECSNFQKLNTQQFANRSIQENIDFNIKFPHRVALGAYYSSEDYVNFSSRAWFCGGSLINEKFILTAAHCLTFEKLNADVEFALIGASSIDAYTKLEQPDELVYKISRLIPHPLYKSPSIYHDIALVELDRPVQFSEFVKPACLYVDEQVDTNIELKTTGWQFTYLGVSNNKIEDTNLQLFSTNECERNYKDFLGSNKLPNGIIDKIQICAGEFQQDSCKADSGSPLEVYVNSTNGATPYLIGIKSFGNTCKLKGIPGIYTRIAPYISWIESVAWNQTETNSTTTDLEKFIKDVELRSGETLLKEASVPLKSTLSERKCLNFREDKEAESRYLILDYINSSGWISVAGGVDARLSEFPHMVALGYSRPENTSDIVWQCGGSLISEKFVLTAAHCVTSSELGNVSWAQLTLDLDDYKNLFTPEQIVYKIVRRVSHPMYKRPLVYHDIALLELDRPVEFSEDKRPACLYTEVDIDPNLQIVATGWGVTEKGEAVNRLQQVTLDIYNHTECSTAYKDWSVRRLRNGIVDGNQICAGKRTGIQDTCPGDSGGPLQFKIPNYVRMSHVVGVTSFGKGGCGFADSPGVYTRVAAYVPWIESVVWPDEYVPEPNQPEVVDA